MEKKNSNNKLRQNARLTTLELCKYAIILVLEYYYEYYQLRTPPSPPSPPSPLTPVTIRNSIVVNYLLRRCCVMTGALTHPPN